MYFSMFHSLAYQAGIYRKRNYWIIRFSDATFRT